MMLGKAPHNFYVIFFSRGNLHKRNLNKRDLVKDSPIKRRNLFNTTETENIEYLLKYKSRRKMVAEFKGLNGK